MISGERVRALVAKHGVVREQPAREWTGALPLPPDVEQYYRDVGPVDVTIAGYGNPYFLPGLAGLWEFQEGYRWNSLTREPSGDWDDDWLVIADEGGDPFILSRSSGVVLLAEHGTGTWEPEELFSDLNAMAACLAILGDVVVGAGDSLTDEDFNIRPEQRARAMTQLAEVVGSQATAEAVLGALGWG